MSAGDLDRVLNRLRSGGERDALLGEVAQRERVELLRKFDVDLIGEHLKAGVRVFLDLLDHRGSHFRVAVPRVEHGDASREIEIALALDVPYLGIFCTRNSNRDIAGDAAGDGRATAAHQFRVAGYEGPISQAGLQ